MKRVLAAAVLCVCLCGSASAGGYIMDPYGNVTFFNGSGRYGSIVQSNGAVTFYGGIRPVPVYPVYPMYGRSYTPYFGPPAPPAPPSPFIRWFGW